MITLVLIASLAAVADAIKCNGMEGLCDLRFNQVTFPGTHNSAANKAMYYGIGTRVSDCWYRNHEHSITRQLQDGIRSFDIDICYRYEEEYENKIWACHDKAFIDPLYKPLSEIANFLNEPKNRNEVVAIRFHDADVTGVWHVAKDLEDAFTKGVMLDDTTPKWPKLKESIDNNKRVFIFVATKVCDSQCQDMRKYRSVNAYDDTWDSWWSGSCYKIPDYTKGKCKGYGYKPLTTVSVFGTWGACLDLVGSTCNQYIKESVENCYHELTKVGHTVNFISVDYYSESQSVIAIAEQVNKWNIQKFG